MMGYLAILILLFIAVNSKGPTSTTSMLEHSYFATITNDYLHDQKLAYFHQQGYFSHICPIPEVIEYLLFKQISNLERRYKMQEQQYLANEKYLERAVSFETLQKYMGKQLFTKPKMDSSNLELKSFQQSEQRQSVMSHIQDFHKQIKHKDNISLNIYVKLRPILALLFLLAFILVLFRLSKRSENSKQQMTKWISVFWFFVTVQQYSELSWNSLDAHPRTHSKLMFLNIIPLDQISTIIPEILNIILLMICLFYFCALVFRCNELLGPDDIPMGQQYQENLNQIAKQQNLAKDGKTKQGGQGSHNEQEDDPLNDDSFDFTMGSLSVQPIIEVPPIEVKTAVDLYHFVVMHLTLFLSFLKLLMLFEGMLFVRVSNNISLCTLDNLEIFPLTPRYLALFTVSFLASSRYIGKTPTDRTQYNFQKGCPFFISALHTAVLIIRRRYQFTIDDLIIGVVNFTSFALYLALDFKKSRQYAAGVSMVLDQAIKSQQRVISNTFNKNDKMRADDRRKMQLIDQQLSKHIEIQRTPQHIDTNLDDYTLSEGDEDSSIESYNDEQYQNERLKLKKISNSRLQQMLFDKLSEISSDELRQLTECTGEIQLTDDNDIIQKLNLLSQLKKRSQQEMAASQATQGGQGQQQSQLKKTSHKAPTKASIGRPNPRKRR